MSASPCCEPTLPGDDLGANAIAVNDQVRALMLELGDQEVPLGDLIASFRDPDGRPAFEQQR